MSPDFRPAPGAVPGRSRAALPVLLPLLWLALAAGGCGPKVALDPVLVTTPREDHAAGLELSGIRWIREETPAENGPWRAAVGPPVVRSGGRAEAVVLDSLAVVSWNTHVGGGDVDRLIADLRSGELTGGGAPRDFVLVLQEVFRRGEEVPDAVPAESKCADAICAESPLGDRRSIEEVAERWNLDLFYVPSMRNGRPTDTAEDRGNAILSTIPLSGWTAFELPVVVQRRVAVGATVRGTTGAGAPWELDLVNLHLDGRAPLKNILGSFGRGRTRQLDFLTRAVDDGRPALLAGDLNTWFRGSGESAVDLARRFFPEPASHPDQATFELGPWGRQLDWVFFRLPGHWDGAYRRVSGKYGSDHYPLLAWVRFGVSSRSADAPIPRTARRFGCATEEPEKSPLLPRPPVPRRSSPGTG